MKISKIRVDISKADKGAWVEMPGEGDFADVHLKVRGLQTFDAQRLRRRLEADLDPSLRINGLLDPEEADRIEATILHECVLVDWTGLEDEDGKTLAFSKEAAAKLLLDRDYVAFRAMVRLAADLVLRRGRETLEAEAGN